MPLHVRTDGTLLRDGKPFRGYGVNHVSCFWRILQSRDDDSFRAGFRALAELGIPFARFAACGYWPRDWALYFQSPSDYWRRLDRVVNAAERSEIGLIPSLFWHYPTAPDLCHDPVQAVANPGSSTRRFLAEYTQRLVKRYRSSPAIWGWEVGNEYNLPADLPNAAQHRPQIAPDRGTPPLRTANDELTHRHVRSVLKFVSNEIRQHDPQRLISSGNAFPRPSAWNQERHGSWSPDTEGQFAEMLAADNPSPIDTLGGHLYQESTRRFGTENSTEALLASAMRTATAARKPLFIGEFGTEANRPREEFDSMLNAMVRSRVPLAAIWVYDFPEQDSDWNVTTRNPRSWQLQRLTEANSRLLPGSR